MLWIPPHVAAEPTTRVRSGAETMTGPYRGDARAPLPYPAITVAGPFRDPDRLVTRFTNALL